MCFLHIQAGWSQNRQSLYETGHVNTRSTRNGWVVGIRGPTTWRAILAGKERLKGAHMGYEEGLANSRSFVSITPSQKFFPGNSLTLSWVTQEALWLKGLQNLQNRQYVEHFTNIFASKMTMLLSPGASWEKIEVWLRALFTWVVLLSLFIFFQFSFTSPQQVHTTRLGGPPGE